MSTALTDGRELGVAERVARLGWQRIGSDLDSYGCAVAKGVLTPEECHELSSCYDHDEHFRSRIVMAWHGFGRGEYRYWAYPLPKTIETLRTTQSRAEAVQLGQGDGVIFAVHYRPVQGTRGTYQVNLRHGVSRLRSGRRHTMGVIFHDAT